jgi:hypothetical protein
MDKAPTFVGIDVSKHRLDVHARPSGEGFAVDYGDEGRGERHQAPDQRRHALIVVVDGEGLAGGAQVDVEPVLGDVDADEGGSLVHDPASLMRADEPW